MYLSGFDHVVKEQIKARQYLRYVDDFALFSDDTDFLAEARLQLERHLAALRLKLHPVKSQLFETKVGVNFVGFRVLPDRLRVRASNLRRARHRSRQLQQMFRSGELSLPDLVQRLRSWEAHLRHGDTQRLRRRLFDELVFVPPPKPRSLKISHGSPW